MTKQSKDTDRPVSFRIHEHIGCLSVNQNGWSRELNVVSWNQGRPRLDIRDWNPEHDKMSRGIGLNGEEVLNLLALMKDADVQRLGI